MGSRFGALAGEEYDKIAPVIACTLPALTDSIPERKRGASRRGDEGTAGSGEGSFDRHPDMGTKQRQDKGKGRGAREEYRMDRAPVHGMEGEPRRTGGVWKTNRRRRHATAIPSSADL